MQGCFYSLPEDNQPVVYAPYEGSKSRTSGAYSIPETTASRCSLSSDKRTSFEEAYRTEFVRGSCALPTSYAAQSPYETYFRSSDGGPAIDTEQKEI